MTQPVTHAPADSLPAPAAAVSDRALPVRDRILNAATALFYAEGIRAVSADKIIQAAGITKVTFYRYFPSKDDLVVAYLENRAAWERAGISHVLARAENHPSIALGLVARALGDEACVPGFRGCAFLNAGAEYPDPEHPVRVVIDEHRRWGIRTAREALEKIGVPDAESVAEELMMLRDGAMISGYVSDPSTVGQNLFKAGRAVIQYRG